MDANEDDVDVRVVRPGRAGGIARGATDAIGLVYVEAESGNRATDNDRGEPELAGAGTGVGAG